MKATEVSVVKCDVEDRAMVGLGSTPMAAVKRELTDAENAAVAKAVDTWLREYTAANGGKDRGAPAELARSMSKVEKTSSQGVQQAIAKRRYGAVFARKFCEEVRGITLEDLMALGSDAFDERAIAIRFCAPKVDPRAIEEVKSAPIANNYDALDRIYWVTEIKQADERLKHTRVEVPQPNKRGHSRSGRRVKKMAVK